MTELRHLRPGFKRCIQCRDLYRPVPGREKLQKYCGEDCRKLHYERKLHRPRTLLDGPEYAEIRDAFKSGEWSYTQLAEKYHCSFSHVWDIVNKLSGEYVPTAYKRTCLWCGKEYTSQRNYGRYCCATHASQASAKRTRDAGKAVAAAEAAKLDYYNTEAGPKLLEALRCARWRREDYGTLGIWTGALGFP